MESASFEAHNDLETQTLGLKIYNLGYDPVPEEVIQNSIDIESLQKVYHSDGWIAVKNSTGVEFHQGRIQTDNFFLTADRRPIELNNNPSLFALYLRRKKFDNGNLPNRNLRLLREAIAVQVRILQNQQDYQEKAKNNITGPTGITSISWEVGPGSPITPALDQEIKTFLNHFVADRAGESTNTDGAGKREYFLQVYPSQLDQIRNLEGIQIQQISFDEFYQIRGINPDLTPPYPT